jgi:hypothetical protein
MLDYLMLARVKRLVSARVARALPPGTHRVRVEPADGRAASVQVAAWGDDDRGRVVRFPVALAGDGHAEAIERHLAGWLAGDPG